MMPVLFNVLFPVFCCVLIGFAWGRSRFDFELTFVTRLVTNIAAPCLIVSTIGESHLQWADFIVMAKLTLAAMLGFAVLGFMVFKILRLEYRPLSLAVVFPNTGNMGLSLCFFAFGDQGLALGLIVFVVVSLVHFSSGDFILNDGRFSERLLKMCTQPLFLATLFAMAQIAVPIELPKPVAATTKLLGGMTIPLMLITLGVSLATLKMAEVGRGLLISLLRVPGGLLVALAVLAVFQVDGLMAKVLILQATMPSAVFNYFFALKYQREEATVASAVVLSTLMSFVLLPVLLWYLLA